MFRSEYSLELIISAVVTFAAILFCVRLYLKLVNRKSKIIKPEWMDDADFERFRAKRGSK